MFVHSIDPVFDSKSKVLILGSFPSVKSREQGFFYGHKQNRFWKVIASVFCDEEPKTIPDKRAFLLKNGIALWDVIKECEINGSSDSSIREVVSNDVTIILKNSNVKNIFTNGKTAHKYYREYIEKVVGKTAICLPSTSPANAVYSLDRLIDEWKAIKK